LQSGYSGRKQDRVGFVPLDELGSAIEHGANRLQPPQVRSALPRVGHEILSLPPFIIDKLAIMAMDEDNEIRLTNGGPSHFDMDEAFCTRMRAVISGAGKRADWRCHRAWN
jgi:hypothetical protein